MTTVETSPSPAGTGPSRRFDAHLDRRLHRRRLLGGHRLGAGRGDLRRLAGGRSVGVLAIAYRFYSRFIAHRVLEVDETRATPAERLNNAVDYHPTDRRCSSATTSRQSRVPDRWSDRCLPRRWATCREPSGSSWASSSPARSRTWSFCSSPSDGESLGQMIREEVGAVGGAAALVAVFSIMIILLAVLALVVVNALSDSPRGGPSPSR